jgi:hypothetical protein
MDENGGGVSGFAKGLYTTFVKNVWAAHENQPSLPGKVVTVFNEFWKKYGIVGVHGFLGNFAADVFLEETGLNTASPTFSYLLKIFLPLAVMLFEGNTEARSLDSYREKTAATTVSYSLYSKLVVSFSGLLHTVPAITSLAIMLGCSDQGPFEGKLYNVLTYLGATAILAYPSAYGFVATTIPGFDEAAKGLKTRLQSWFSTPAREGYEDLEPRDEARLCVLLGRCGFLGRKSNPPERRDYLIYGNDSDEEANLEYT